MPQELKAAPVLTAHAEGWFYKLNTSGSEAISWLRGIEREGKQGTGGGPGMNQEACGAGPEL